MDATSGSQVFRFGACVLDLQRGTLERSGVLVAIRAKTFRLLCHLARNAGRVVSKDELLTGVWPDVTVTEDSLTQGIRDLRRAIGDDSQEIVRTIARRGYLFALPLGPPPTPADRGVAQPRVAVLPLRNLNGDPDDGILIDGIVEEITNGLARFGSVTVIARHSAFAFRPEDRPSLEAVGARLGADYLVDGTARRIGGRLQFAVALSEVASGRQLWGESFDCSGEDLLALQQVIPRRIVSRLVSNIENSVLNRSLDPPTASVTAFEQLTRGVALLRSYGPDVNERGRAHLLRAIEIDPGYGLAHAYLVLAELLIAGFGLAPPEVLERARQKAMTAVTLAPGEARCHRMMAFVRLELGEHAAAEQSMKRALELNSYDADNLAVMGIALNRRGRAAEGLDWVDRAAELNPLHPESLHSERALSLYMLGRYGESAAALQCVPRRGVLQETRMAATLAMAGRVVEAAGHLARAEELVPGWQHLEAAQAYKLEHAEDTEHLLAGIRIALAGRSPVGTP